VEGTCLRPDCLCLSASLSLPLTITHTLTLTRTLSVSLSLALSLSYSLSLSPSLSLSLSLATPRARRDAKGLQALALGALGLALGVLSKVLPLEPFPSSFPHPHRTKGDLVKKKQCAYHVSVRAGMHKGSKVHAGAFEGYSI